MIAIPCQGGTMPALLARPAATPAGVVVLAAEIFGVNRAMAATARWIAALGHVALCPDLYWRQAKGVALDPDGGAAAWRQALALMRGLDEAAAVADLAAALAVARRLPCGNGRAAVLGFCLGGRLAARLAVAGGPDGAVAYYGVGLETVLDGAAPLAAPLLLHLAGRDRYVPAAAQARILAAASRDPAIEVLVHPAAEHGFARLGAASFDARAASVAQARTEAALRRWL